MPRVTMDFLVATLAPQYAEKWKRGEDFVTQSASQFAMFVLSNIVSIFAAWLSWNCSTQQGLGTVAKLGWAALAYMFGFLYIVFYAWQHRDACKLLVPAMPMMM